MDDEGDDEKEGGSRRLQALLDFYWFQTLILHKTPPPPPPPPPPEVARPDPLPRRLLHRRSLSDELNSSSASASPLRIRPPPRLQTILSGKESESSDGFEIDGGEARRGYRRGRSPGRRDRRGRRRGKSSRSLSDLEFEEVKGFIDLGFSFSDADSDPRLMSLVPGLQRLRPPAAEGSPPSDEGDGGVPRPYLSEAWEEEEERALREWKIPAVQEGVDLKDHLRFWAHAVASAVR